MKRTFVRDKRVVPDSIEPLELTVEKQERKRGGSGMLRQLITIGVYVLVFGLFMRGGVQSMGVYVILMAAGVVSTILVGLPNVFRRSDRFPFFRVVNRKKVYREYLAGLAEKAKAYLTDCDRKLRQRYVPASGLLKTVQDMGWQMYSRLPQHQDFLAVNLGEAAAEYPLDIRYPSLTYSERDRELAAFREEIGKALDEHRRNTLPCLYSLKEKKSLALVNKGMEPERFMQIVNACVADIAAAHSPEEVTLCGVFGREMPLLWMRMLPHVWHEGRRLLFCGTESEKEFAGLVAEAVQNGSKHVVAVVDADAARSCSFYAMFNSTALPEKLSVLFYSAEGLTPTRVAASVLYSGKAARGDMAGRVITPGRLEDADAESIARLLYNTELRDNAVKTAQGMPNRLTFFDMAGVRRAVELPRLPLAQQAAIQNRFPVLVGQGRNGEDVYIDLSNDGDGNHCLVTGTNGSGKSEFVIAFVMSACSMYAPDYLSFVVIDFKGAAMSSKINCLPHCRGEFTNADGNPTQREIARITELLEAEITYRERVMKEADCANNLNAYHRLYAEGRVNIPLPRLLVVVDEVAVFFDKDEAAAKNITHIATVGRAVGLILMLSTQSKHGVIPSQVRTNINVTVEFYSEDEEKDKREIIKGRAIVNSYRKVNCECQMAYTATRDTNASLVDFLRMSGSSRLVGGSGNKLQFDLIRDEIVNRFPIEQFGDKLPDVVTGPLEKWHTDRLSLKWLQEMYRDAPGASPDAFPVGVSDNIYERNHKFFTYRPGRENLLLYGKSRSGKTTFIKTLLASMCSRKYGLRPNAAGVYIIARDPGEYRSYGFPHVGSILPESELYYFLLFLQRTIEKRRSMESGHAAPIVAVIDGCYNTICSNEGLMRMLRDVTAESVRHGVSVILTMTKRSSLDFGGLRHFDSVMAFHMGDDFSYSTLEPMHVDAIRQIPDIPGRCLVDIAGFSGRTLETQIACPWEEGEEEIARQAAEYTALWRGKPVPEAVPLMPEHVHLTVKPTDKAVPMGLARDLTVCTWEPEKRSSCLISYFVEEDALAYTGYVARALARMGHPVLLVDDHRGRLSGLECIDNIRVFSPDDMEAFRDAVIASEAEETPRKTAIVVWDYATCMYPNGKEDVNLNLVGKVCEMLRCGSIIGVFAAHKEFQLAARSGGLTRLPQYLEGVGSGVLIGREPSAHTFGYSGLSAVEQGRPLEDGWGVNVSPRSKQICLMKLAEEVTE